MTLTREQCNGLKGYAILLIVIHNYVDHIMGMGCNEMAYSQAATTDFTTMVMTQPSIWHFFSREWRNIFIINTLYIITNVK